MFKTRIKKFQNYINIQKSFGFIVTNTANIYYFSGFKGISEKGREAVLLVFAEQKPILIVPKMYEFQASNLETIQNNIIDLKILDEGKGFIEIIAEKFGIRKKVLFEEYDLYIEEYQKINKICNCSLYPSKYYIYKQRSIKDKGELEFIKKAVKLTDKVYKEVIDYIKGNDYLKLTEIDIAEKIRELGFKMGGEGLGFYPIIASGRGSAEPHYKPQQKTLEKGEVLLFDLGVKYKGYSGDLSRCILLGSVPRNVKDIYQKVLECNELCIKQCRLNKRFGDIHDKAIDFFSNCNLNKYFLHSIGHGLGLEEHEYPFPKAKDDVLQEGMVFTIEPGLYFENQFGIRIEDVVLMTCKGPEILSNQKSKTFTEII